MQPVMYEIEVPAGVAEGQAFQASVGGILMLITCPEGVAPGQLIQVAGPSQSMPTVSGVPVNSSGSPPGMVTAGMPVGGLPMGGMQPQMMYGNNGVMMQPEVGYVEVEEISPAGWACLIVGCFACPGLNLLGLCMRERRLVPVSQIGSY